MKTVSQSQATLSRLHWGLDRISRRTRTALCSKLYRDRDPEPHRSIIVAGTARSGSTWLADIIASQIPARIMFEPFNPELVKDFACFNYFHYMRPEQEDEALYRVVRRVLTGRIRHPWIDRKVEILRPQWRIVKEIRACLFLRWIHERFPEVPMVFIIRHPCAFVASMTRLNWSPQRDLDSITAQPALLADHLAGNLQLLRNAGTDAEKHAIVWSVSNLVALRQFRDAPLHVVFYEDLLNQPRAAIPGVFQHIGQPFTETVYEHARRPSTTTRIQSPIFNSAAPALASWRRDLPADTIASILGIVDEFGLGHLYGESGLPLLKTSRPGELLHG